MFVSPYEKVGGIVWFPRMLRKIRLLAEGRLPEAFQPYMGIGFDATVVIRTKRLTRLKGFAMYMTAVMQTIALNYDAPDLELAFDDEYGLCGS